MFGESFREMLQAAGINVPPPDVEEAMFVAETEHERKSLDHCKEMTSKADVLINDMLIPAMKKYVEERGGEKIDSLSFVMALTMFAKQIVMKNTEPHPMELGVVTRIGSELQKAHILLGILGGGPCNVIGCTLTSIMAYITMNSFHGIMDSSKETEHENENSSNTPEV